MLFPKGISSLSLLLSTAALLCFSPSSSPGSEPSDQGVLRGLEEVTDPLPWFDDQNNYPVWDTSIRDKRPNAVTAVTTLGAPPMEEPFELLLTRSTYPAEDKTLDILVRLANPDQAPEARMEVRIFSEEAGEYLVEEVIDPLPGPAFFFSLAFPEAMVGTEGDLELTLLAADGTILGEATEPFRVSEPEDNPRSGTITLTVPNTTEATANGIPMTTGVPFPRGSLWSADHLRLALADGTEIPLQAMVTSTWSRYGSIRWVLLDFVVDVEGEPLELTLEFGPDVERTDPGTLDVEELDGPLPLVQTGALQFGPDGIAAQQNDTLTALLGPEGPLGAYVEHADDRKYDNPNRRVSDFRFPYVIPRESDYEIEELGPVKTVIRKQGYYGREDGAEFNRYDIRYILHRDSPLVRIFHTWIFTGDGNRDRIADMGWRFDLAEGVKPSGFLSSFDDPEWLDGNYLLQFDHDEYEVVRFARRQDVITATGSRAPGVMAAEGNGFRVYTGVKDFWQNYPFELEFEEDQSMVIHQWPRHGKERRHTTSVAEGHRLWFVHEGDLLDFSLPRELVEDPFFTMHSRGETHWTYGQPETVNAQGIAKTTEMWIYLAPEEADPAESLRVLEGLNEETLRAMVDPQWIARSGALPRLHPKDPEQFPEEERLFEQQLLKPIKQAEFLNIYGKWVHGDLLRSFDPASGDVTALYRLFRKAHWGWPYSYIGFARSGDPRMLKFAQAATRMMSDVAYCHYVSEEVAEQFANFPKRRMWYEYQPFRARGFWNRNMIPWAGYYGPTTRMYVDEVEHLWQSWYLTGYHRARDVALDWAELSKIEDPEFFGRGPITAGFNRARWPMNLQKQYLETYQAIFDPWFISAAYAINQMHLHRYYEENWGGHPWNTGPGDLLLYTDNEDVRTFFLNLAEFQTDWRNRGWASTLSTLIPLAVQGYEETGDPVYLRRVAGMADFLRWSVYDGEEPFNFSGWYTRAGSDGDLLWTGWLQKWFPSVLGALDAAEEIPPPISPPFQQVFGAQGKVHILKSEGQEVLLGLPDEFTVTGPDGEEFTPTESDGRYRSEYRIPEDAPPGIYEFSFPPRAAVMLPLSAPGNKEVFVFEETDEVPQGRDFAQYWFEVPEGVSRFEVTFPIEELWRQNLRHIGIWNPDGQRVWEHVFVDAERPSDESITAVVEVPSGQTGRLWRITWPGQRTAGFTLDESIPARFAHDPDRWFAE